MNISVFGLGYVGSVSAACLARAGHHVIGVDVNADKVALIRAGRSPIVETGLPELINDVVRHGALEVTTDVADAVTRTDLALICVGTPSLPHGRPDTEALERVAREIGAAIGCSREEPFTVVLRSTVLPGTTERVLGPALLAGGADAALVRIAMNPEFMREGSSLRDFDHPPLILVGTDDLETAEKVRTVYTGVEAPFAQTALRTAEFVKYASNAFHALKVCFANEIGDLAEALGADPQEATRLFLMDRKLNVSEAYLRPGFAFGGSCLPKDLRAMLWAARSEEVAAPLLSSLLPANAERVQSAIDRVMGLRRRRVGVAGLAFKPGTDDLRESPVVAVVEGLIGKGCDVKILDRYVNVARLVGANRQYIESEIPHIASLLCDSAEALADHADVLVVGGATTDAAEALALVRPDCVVIDLTRGAVLAATRLAEAQCVPA